MSKIKAVHIDHSSNAKPRRLDSLAALVRSGQHRAIFDGIRFVADPMFRGMSAVVDREQLAREVNDALLDLAQQTYGDSE
jgi:hypothetical protein